MKLRKIQLAILAASLAGAMSASAVIVTYTGASPAETINVQSTGSIGFNLNGRAGVYNLIVDGVGKPSFCIDVYRDITPGETLNNYSYASLDAAPLSPAGPMSASAAVDVRKLWAAYYSPSINAAQAAALQLAIWETVDNGQAYTVSSSDALVQPAANALLASLSGLTAQADLMALVSPTGQNFVVAVPEPATVLAATLLLLPFGASAARVLRKKQAA